MRMPRPPRPRSAGQRAAEAADRLEAARGDADVILRPWEYRLPRLVLLEIARSRGFAPVGPVSEVGDWHEPLRLTRSRS